MRPRPIHLLVFLGLLVALVRPVLGQSIESPGPFAVGVADVTFEDVIFNQGRITARLYYPAESAGQNAAPDPSGGPFPLVGFQHGYLGSPDNYDDLCTHIASWGFVVASTGTETGFFPDQRQYARDTRSLLYFVEAESDDAGSLFFGMTDDGPWAASGHSMGGGVLPLLIGIEPRIETIIGLQSAFVDDERVDYLRAFTGNHYQVAGSRDFIVPPSQVVRYFEEAVSARRSVYFEVQGMGHGGPTDDPSNSEPLPAAEQQRLHRRLVTGLLRAEVKGEENLYAELLGEGIADEPVELETRCLVPPLWVRPSTVTPEALVVGTAGAPRAEAVLAWSDAPDAIPTPYGEVGIDFSPERVLFRGPVRPDGTAEALLTEDEVGAAPVVYVQGLVRAGSLGRVTRVETRDTAARSEGAAALTSGTPTAFGAAPNPFSERTTLRFTLPVPATVEVAVYDALGRRVRRLADGTRGAGPHVLAWDGRDDAGRRLAAGVYLLRVRAGGFSEAVPVVRVE